MLYLLSLLFAATKASDPGCQAIEYGDSSDDTTVLPTGTCITGGSSVSYQYVCNGDKIRLSQYDSSDCSGGAALSVDDACGSGAYDECIAYCDGEPCQVVTFKQYTSATSCEDTETAIPSLGASFIANFCDSDGEIYACASGGSGNVTKEVYEDDTCSGNATYTYEYAPCSPYLFGGYSTYVCAMATDAAAYFKIIGALMVVFVASLF